MINEYNMRASQLSKIYQHIGEISNWVAALPKEDREETFLLYPEVLDDWDENYGDRINQIVFIGKGYSMAEVSEKLNQCLDFYENIHQNEVQTNNNTDR